MRLVWLMRITYVHRFCAPQALEVRVSGGLTEDDRTVLRAPKRFIVDITRGQVPATLCGCLQPCAGACNPVLAHAAWVLGAAGCDPVYWRLHLSLSTPLHGQLCLLGGGELTDGVCVTAGRKVASRQRRSSAAQPPRQPTGLRAAPRTPGENPSRSSVPEELRRRPLSRATARVIAASGAQVRTTAHQG